MKIIQILSLLILCVCSKAGYALIVLQYQDISEGSLGSINISKEVLAQHLNFLEQEKFQVASAAKFKKAISSKEIPDKTAVITFDGGYKSVYKVAYPLLKKRKLPFIVFVNSQAHDGQEKDFMTWKELLEMSKNGAVIANRSDSHAHLIRKRKGESDADWLRRVEGEIDFAEDRIKSEIGRASRLFSYPYGEYNSELQRLLKRKDFLAFGKQPAPISSKSHEQLLPRFVMVARGKDTLDFVEKVYSIPFPMLNVEVNDQFGTSLEDPLLPDGLNAPILKLNSPMLSFLDKIACFTSVEGQIKYRMNGKTLVVKASRNLPVGRSFYQCRANAGGGRYYWYSQLFIKRFASGAWYKE